MTLQELCDQYQVTESTVRTKFKTAQQQILKRYGVIIEKEGRGQNASYHIKCDNYIDPLRAPSMYMSKENNTLPCTIAAYLLDINFLAFLGIASTPQRSFRGSYYDFLRYLELSETANNVAIVKQALQYLSNQSYIMYIEDDTDTDYFMAGIKRKAELEMSVQLSAAAYFRSLVADSKRSWVPLMKVYLALHFLKNPCTIQQICDATQLSQYAVRQSLKILSKNIVINRKKVVELLAPGCFHCHGTEYNINAFGIKDIVVDYEE